MTTKKIETPELDFADAQQLKHFQMELLKASRGEISADWIRRSFEALPASVKALFGELPTG